MLRLLLALTLVIYSNSLIGQTPAGMQASYEALLRLEESDKSPELLYEAWRTFLTTYAGAVQQSDAARHMLNDATTHMLQHRRYLAIRSQPPIDYSAPPVTYPTRYIGSRLRHWQRNDYVQYVTVPASQAARFSVSVGTMFGTGYSPYGWGLSPWDYGMGVGPGLGWGGGGFGYSPFSYGSVWGSPFGYSPW